MTSLFDPTIYDNIKVVLEGEIYDLDLSGKVNVVDRQDLVNLALMTRRFIIKFNLVESNKEINAEINLFADTGDLSREILDYSDGEKPGCEIIIKFITFVTSPDNQCSAIEEALNNIWDYRPTIIQVISYKYDKINNTATKLKNEIKLSFGRKIDEDNIKDIHNLLEYTIRSLEALDRI